MKKNNNYLQQFFSFLSQPDIWSINPKKKIISAYKHFWNDSLYRNSIYLMLNTVIMSIFGFIFWIICSRLYSPEQVGYATTIISAVSLASVFSTLGLDNVNIRFISKSKDRNTFISTGFLLVTVTSLIVSALTFILIINTNILKEPHQFTLQILVLFYLYVFFISFNNLLDSIFIAFRSTNFILIKNTCMSIFKVLLPLFFIRSSFLSIINSVIISISLSSVFGVIILFNKFYFRPQIKINNTIIEQTKHFALGNFIGNIFAILPGSLIPILIAWKLAPSYAAFYYIPFMISGVLKIIPSATAQSLFAEASHDEVHLQHYLLRAMKSMFVLLIFAILGIFLFANFALQIFGSEYDVQGVSILKIFALSSIIASINYLGDTVLNIRKKMRTFVFMNIFNSLLIVLIVYILVPYGLIWVAFGELIGQLVTAIVYAMINKNLIKSLLPDFKRVFLFIDK